MDGTMMRYPLTLPHILDIGGKRFKNVGIVSGMPDRSFRRCDPADLRGDVPQAGPPGAVQGVEA